MDLSDQTGLSFYAAASGAAALAVAQASIRQDASVAWRSAVAFAALLSVNCFLNVVQLIWLTAPPWMQSLSAVTIAGLAPVLWIYVDDITSPVVRSWKRADAWKFFTVGLALMEAGFMASLPQEVIRQLTDQSGSPGFLGYAYLYFDFFVLVCIFLQSTYYVYRTIRRLGGLPPQLKQLFSNAVERRPTWLWLVIVLLILNWLVTFSYNFDLLAVPSWVFGLLAFAFSISFCAWSVQQRPSFLEEDGTRNSNLSFEDAPGRVAQASVKYQRSLLPEDRMVRIASKITRAFSADKLHLDPVLSLSKLSKHLSVPEQHLSQTFTRHLGTSFYDFVNLHRIESAKERLAESDDLIVDIAFAVGYNSRSAFYNAFKLITGQTPSAYRATGKLS